jgi:hypothetical protein
MSFLRHVAAIAAKRLSGTPGVTASLAAAYTPTSDEQPVHTAIVTGNSPEVTAAFLDALIPALIELRLQIAKDGGPMMKWWPSEENQSGTR